MDLKSLLDDFAAACGDHRKISYNLWRQLTKFANDKKGCIYFLKHPDTTNRNLLSVLYDFENEYYLYIPEDPLYPTGYLNQYIYNTPFYRQGIYPPLGKDINWPKYIDTMLAKYGWTLWPVKEFNELIEKESEPEPKKHEFVASTPTVVNPGDKINFISCDTRGKIVSGDISNATPLTYVSSNIGNMATNFNTITSTFDETNERLTKLEKALNNKKENDTMDTKNIINFDFGPAGSAFRLSPYGIAAHMGDNWIVYNPTTSEMMNVDIFNFKVDKLIYKMPVAIQSLEPGDLIIHQKVPMFVRSVDNVAGTVEAINYRDSTVANILPVKSPFGFNFVTKIVSLLNLSKMNPDTDNPFGNMLPLMFLSGDGETDTTTLCMAMMMMQNGELDMSNPMMMYFLLAQDDNRKDSLLPLVFMMNQK